MLSVIKSLNFVLIKGFPLVIVTLTLDSDFSVGVHGVDYAGTGSLIALALDADVDGTTARDRIRIMHHNISNVTHIYDNFNNNN